MNSQYVLVVAALVFPAMVAGEDREVSYRGNVVFLIGSRPAPGARVQLLNGCGVDAAEVMAINADLGGNFTLMERLPATPQRRCIRALAYRTSTISDPIVVPPDKVFIEVGPLMLSQPTGAINLKAAQQYAQLLTTATPEAKKHAYQELAHILAESDPKIWQAEYVRSDDVRRLLGLVCEEACSQNQKYKELLERAKKLLIDRDAGSPTKSPLR